MVEVREAKIDEIINVRHTVLRPGRPISTAHFEGDHEPDTIHLGAFIEGCVGCLTLMDRKLKAEPAYQLRGMATLAGHQYSGIGAKLLSHAGHIAVKQGKKKIWCNARKEAVGFYQKYKWRIISDEFMVSDIGPHYKMVKDLL